MRDDLIVVAKNRVESKSGYSVWTGGVSGVYYRDGDGTVRIASEWLASPGGIVVYKGTRADPRYAAYDEARKDEIIVRIVEALEMLGYRPEVA